MARRAIDIESGRRREVAAAVVAIAAPLAVCVGALALFLPRDAPPTRDTRAPAPYVVVSPAAGRAPLRVRFDATGSIDDLGITAYRWDFGDGSAGEGDVVDHVYEVAGTYEARLVVGDAAGLTSEALSVVRVAAPSRDRQPPVARIDAPVLRGTVPFEATFDASGSTDDRAIARHRWRLGERSASGATLRHVFAKAGIHRVELEVADAAGHTSTAHVEVHALAAPPSAAPVAAARATPDRATAPAEIEFDARASTDDRGPVLYEWYFGDGDRATGARVRHRYAKAGRFTALLVVWDDSGQAARTTVDVDVEAPDMVSDRVLFDDDLAAGVTDGSWAEVAPDLATVHAGRRSMRVRAGPHGAVRLAFAPERLEAYDRVAFWVRGDDVEALSVRAVLFEDGRETLGPAVPLGPHLLAGRGGAHEGVWRRAAVRLDALGAARRHVSGFAVQAPARGSTFLLDDLSLVPPDRPLPVVSECAMPPPATDFVERHGSALAAAGAPFRAVGANLYYMQQELSRHVQTGERRPLARVREALDAAVCAGATVVRILGFNEHPPEAQDITVIQAAPGVLREEGLLGLDLAIAEAKSHHLRVVLTLANNWSHFGGLPRYATWAGVPSERVLAEPRVREWLVDYSEALATRVNAYTGVRYQDEPAILAVEVANELRCRDCPRGSDATAFTIAIARAIRPHWPNHLVGDGGEGFDDAPRLYPNLRARSLVSGDEGTSFHRIALAPEIDLVSYHLYPDHWRLEGDDPGFYIDGHEAIARAAGKVAYLGEFGEHAADTWRATTYERWLDRVFVRNGGSLALVWQITYPSRPDNDGFALIPGLSPRTMGALARQARFLATPGLGTLAGRDGAPVEPPATVR